MPSAYAHGSSSSGSAYAGRGGGTHVSSGVRAAPPKGKKKHHGIGGLVENLGQDIATSIAGIPAGIVHTVEHPIGTAKQIAKSYEDTYGPLVHGDISKFLHNVYSHPL